MSYKNRCIMFTLSPVIIFILTSMRYYRDAIQGLSDISVHMEFALSLHTALPVAHCGWHLLTWLLYAALPIGIEMAAACATGLCNALTAVIILWFADRFFEHRFQSPMLPTVITLVSLLVGPLYLRFYNARYLIGQGSPNVWHNPTTVACRPFMLLTGILTIDLWNCNETETVQIGKYHLKRTVLLQMEIAAALFFSTLTKPSFLIAYGPAVFLMALVRLIKTRGKNFLFLIRQHLYAVPSVLLCAYQYIRVYFFGGARQTEGGVEIALFKAARLYTPSIPVSLILRMCFPILVILIWRKKVCKDQLFRLLLLQYIIALITYWTLAETGPRANAGNFGWGNILCSSFLWIYCLFVFVREMLQDLPGPEAWRGCGAAVKMRYLIPGSILLWHLTAGTIWLVSYMK